MAGASGSWDAPPTGIAALWEELIGFFSPAGSDANNFYNLEYNNRLDAITSGIESTTGGVSSVITSAIKNGVASVAAGAAAGFGIPVWLLYLFVAAIIFAVLVFYFKLV